MSKSFAKDIADAAVVAIGVVRHVMEYIRRERFTFVREDKGGLDGGTDIVTNVDKQAQRIYVERLSALFPTFGFIGEEDELNRKCRYKGNDAYWVVDPIDGTEAFSRKQSHGIGTMLALVANGKVAASFIGDVCTDELYAYGPEDSGAWRFDGTGLMIPLEPVADKALVEQFVLLGQRPETYSSTMQRLIDFSTRKGLFKDIEIDKGSIGIRMARLWKGEVGGQVFRSDSYETPWDNTPLIGFCKQLGFVFLRQDGSRRYVEFEPRLLKSPRKVPYETLIIHQSRLGDLRQWEQKLRG